jgi:hypothetical protein
MKDMTYVIQQTLIDASTYDAYYYARRILSFHINFNFGLSLNDLPDTSELCDISDTICDIIKEHRGGDINENNAIYDIQMILSDIDIDFIECQVY